MFSDYKHLTSRVAILLLLTGSALAGNDLRVEEVLHHHLDSVGTPAARSAAKSRVVEGTAAYKILVGGSGRIDGKSVLVSEGHKFQLLLKINALKYHGEKFLCDGDKTFVEGTYDDHSRSEFGEFLRSEDLPLSEGLIGGTLSTTWPLFDLDARKGALKYLGRKKVEGNEREVVSYRPKKGTDMDVTLYFDPQTFRHVMTVYKTSVHAGIVGTNPEGPTSPIPGGAETASARQQQTRYKIEERFSDFKENDGLTLPSRYDLRFTEELANGFTKTVEWDVTTTRVLNGVTLDPRNFRIP